MFGMRASALLLPEYEATGATSLRWALLSISTQCVCMWRGGVMKTSDAPHLTGSCWNLGWILLYKFLLGKMEELESQRTGCGRGKEGGKEEGWLHLLGVKSNIACPFPGAVQDKSRGTAQPPCVGHLSRPPCFPLGAETCQHSQLLSSAQLRTLCMPMYLYSSVPILSSEKSFYVLQAEREEKVRTLIPCGLGSHGMASIILEIMTRHP